MINRFGSLHKPLPSDIPIPRSNDSDVRSTDSGAPQKSGGKVIRAVCGGLLLVICIIAAGGVSVLLEETFVSWWVPISFGLICAVPLTWLTYKAIRWVCGLNKIWLNTAIGLVWCTAICSCTILTVNFVTALNAPDTPVKAEIIHKERLTKKQTRRIGRRHYATDRVYYVYEITTRLSDNRVITLPTSLEVYNRIRTGQHINIPVKTGVFGWDVVNPHDVVYPKFRKKPRSLRKTNPAIQ